MTYTLELAGRHVGSQRIGGHMDTAAAVARAARSLRFNLRCLFVATWMEDLHAPQTTHMLMRLESLPGFLTRHDL